MKLLNAIDDGSVHKDLIMKNFMNWNQRKFDALSVRPKSLRLEALEERQMLSVTDLASLAAVNDAALVEVAANENASPAIELGALEVAEELSIDEKAVDELESQGAHIGTTYIGDYLTSMVVDVSDCKELTISDAGGAFSRLSSIRFMGTGDTQSLVVDVKALNSIVLSGSLSASGIKISAAEKLDTVRLAGAKLDSLTIACEGVSTLNALEVSGCGLSNFVLQGSYPSLSSLDLSGNSLKTADASAARKLSNLTVDDNVKNIQVDHGSAPVTIRFKTSSAASSFHASAYGGMPIDVTSDGDGYVKMRVTADEFDKITVTSPVGAAYVNALMNVEQHTKAVSWADTHVVLANVDIISKLYSVDLNLVKVALDSFTVEQTALYVTLNSNGELVYNGGLSMSDAWRTVTLTCESGKDDAQMAFDKTSVDFRVGPVAIDAPAYVNFVAEESTSSQAVFKWAAVDNAPGGYFYSCVNNTTGEVVEGRTDSTSFKIDGEPGTRFDFCVRALADANDRRYIDSDTISTQGYVKLELATPVVSTYFISAQIAGITWNAVEHAVKYVFEWTIIEDSQVVAQFRGETEATKFNVSDGLDVDGRFVEIPDGAQIDVNVKAIADRADKDYGDSENGSTRFNLKKYLDSPILSVPEITKTSAKFTWEPVEHAVSYSIAYTVNEEFKLEDVSDLSFVVTGPVASTVTFYVIATTSQGDPDYVPSKPAWTCVKFETIKLGTPNIALSALLTDQSSMLFVWDAVDNASAYALTITNTTTGESSKLQTSETFLSLEGKSGDHIQVDIQAVSNDPYYTTSDVATATGMFKYVLDTPVVVVDEVNVDSATISWAAIEGASEYRLTWLAIGDAETRSVSVNTAGTTYAFNAESYGAVIAEGSTIVFSVRALADPESLRWTDGDLAADIVVLKNYLAAPVVDVVEVTNRTAEFAWTAVENAAGYKVVYTIDDSEDVVENIADTTFTVEAYPGAVVNISVIAIAAQDDAQHVDSKAGEATAWLELIKLEAPVVSVDPVATNQDRIVFAWAPVEGADRYQITYVNETTGETETSLGAETKIVVNGNSGDRIALSVQACSDSAYYAASDVANADGMIKYMLASPEIVYEEVGVDSATISWNASEGAIEYHMTWGVLKDGTNEWSDTVDVHTTDTTYTFDATTYGGLVPEGAKLSFMMQAIADPQDAYWTSGVQEYKVFSLKNYLATPVVNVVDITTSSVDFAWEDVEGAVSYNVVYTIDNGEEIADNVVDAAYTIFAAPGSIVNIAVTAVAADGDEIYVDSKDSGSASATIKDVAAIKVERLLDSVAYNKLGAVVATFEAVKLDPATIVVLDNGQPTDLFAIDGSSVVVANKLLNVATDHNITLVAGDVVSDNIAVEATGKLAKPTKVVASDVTQNSVTISWKANAEATAYSVQYAVGASKTFKVDEVSGDTTTITIDGLKAATDYRVRVKAINVGAGLSSDATYVNVTTEAEPSLTIEQVVDSVRHDAIGAVVATFDAVNVDPSTITIIDNGEESGLFAIEGNTVVVASSLLNASNPHDITLVAGDLVTDTITVAVTGKLAKTTAKVDAVSYDSISVSWKAVEGASAYSVQYVKGTGKTFKVVEVPGDQLSYTIEGLKADTDYRVRVKAVAVESGLESDAAYVSATTAPAPSIAIEQVVDSVKYDAIGAVVATFDVVSLDPSAIVVLDNGEPTGLFAIEGNNVVVAGNLLDAANPHEIVLTVGDIAADAISVAVTGKLAKTTVKLVDVTDSSATISWKAVKGATAYSVQYAVGTSKTFKAIEVSGDQLSYTIEGLKAATNYRVRVKAIAGASGISSDATYVNATTLAVAEQLEDEDLFEILAASILN